VISAERARPERPLFFWLVVTFGAAGVAAQILGVVFLARYGGARKAPGWRATWHRDGWFVTQVERNGAAEGSLEDGDRLVSVDGDARAALVGPSAALRRVSPGAVYEVRVTRAGRERLARLALLEVPRSAGELSYLVTILLLSAAFLGTALVIGALKPEDADARRGAASLYLSSYTLLSTVLWPLSPGLSTSDAALYFLVPVPNPVHLAFAYAFYSRFPSSAPRGRAGTAIGRILFAVGGALWIAEEVMRRVAGERPVAAGFTPLFPALAAFDSLDGPFSLLAFASLSCVIAYRFRLVKEPDQKRRVRWIAYGSLVGLSGWLLYDAVSLVLPPSDGLAVFNRVANLALLVVPVVTALAIVKHRLFDIDVVVRRGLQYLLARRVLSALLALPIVGLVVSVWENRNQTLEKIVLHGSVYFYLSAAGFVLLAFRKKLTAALDRRFFREAYDRETILVSLARDVAKLDSFSEISRHVSHRLAAAFHPKSVRVFQRELERGSQMLVFSSSEEMVSPRIADDAVLLRVMESEERPLDFPLSERALPAGERRWLEDMGVALIVPMIGSEGRLVGLVLLGEKMSEEPYGANDRRLLSAIATQMALFWENSQLKGKVEREQRFKHEVLSRFEGEGRLVKECPRCGACYDGAEQTKCPDDGSELAASLPISRTLIGRYRLDRLIGRGGMGAVYESTDLALGRRVAVKVLLGHRLLNRGAIRRFEREARASAKLNHPNIIAVYDYGALESQGAFLVMELVHGVTLRRELKRLGRLEPRTAARYFRQVLEGVKAAHAAGVVHRDLKPENVLIQRDGGDRAIKILDFGLAKVSLLDLQDPDSLTLPGAVLGTLGYMSPEQVSGGASDERSDIFAIGVLLVEALTGQLPFKGATARDMMIATINTPYRLEGATLEIQRLDAVLQRCIAKDPAGRFASIAELADELIPALLDCPPLVPPPGEPPDELPTRMWGQDPIANS
jgi:hypothetical protein